jgi:hypothetical protein
MVRHAGLVKQRQRTRVGRIYYSLLFLAGQAIMALAGGLAGGLFQ